MLHWLSRKLRDRFESAHNFRLDDGNFSFSSCFESILCEQREVKYTKWNLLSWKFIFLKSWLPAFVDSSLKSFSRSFVQTQHSGTNLITSHSLPTYQRVNWPAIERIVWSCCCWDLLSRNDFPSLCVVWKISWLRQRRIHFNLKWTASFISRTLSELDFVGLRWQLLTRKSFLSIKWELNSTFPQIDWKLCSWKRSCLTACKLMKGFSMEIWILI